MEIEIDLKRSLEKNADSYFEKAKRFKKKAKGAKEAVERFKKQLQEIELKNEKEQIKEEKEREQREKTKRTAPEQWYEKFRWFISSEGFLCIGGRDATTNEIIIKKHTDKDDIVFHTEMPGSPFFVIKCEGKKPGETTIQETGAMTFTFSKAWKMNITAGEVFYVKPEQVSKKAPSGEYMAKGAFMITGKRNIIPAKIELAIGILKDTRAMAGALNAVKKNCEKYNEIIPGKNKPTECAKKIAKNLNANIDEILKLLPGGSCEIKN